MARSAVPRPLLKWAGGKTQLLDALFGHIPQTSEGYHEPFVGVGALFFALHSAGSFRGTFLSDLNAELIDTYAAVRVRVDEVVDLLAEYPHSKEFFYQLRPRDLWTMSEPEWAAWMIYLKKAHYNGLY